MQTFFTEEEASRESRLPAQALSFAVHTLIGLGSWAALMLVGYVLNPAGIPHMFILLASLAVPLVVGFAVAKFKQDEMALVVWLVGLVWFLIVALYVLDMPTGPNQCFQCDATDKLTRTFFSLPKPSGLLDDDGPFVATWPAFALLGYSIGARLGIPMRKPE